MRGKARSGISGACTIETCSSACPAGLEDKLYADLSQLIWSQAEWIFQSTLRFVWIGLFLQRWQREHVEFLET
ncbi:MAG: hypothetical protein ACOX5R_19860 [bacterium]